jgi:hypothetical protein
VVYTISFVAAVYFHILADANNSVIEENRVHLSKISEKRLEVSGWMGLKLFWLDVLELRRKSKFEVDCGADD